ncbi:AMP-binding protein [Vulgatibacter sp.]|uniref:AMP-binding protein n=1 Tax=Vulgatibacter sp. TaxID=1971226 RepID=UPI003565F427
MSHPLLPGLASRGEKIAVRIGDDSLSFAALAHGADSHAARLLASGLRPGDRVAVWAVPHLATVVALVGNARAGLVTVPLNPALGERELEHVLRDAAPQRIFAASPGAFEARTPFVDAIELDGAGYRALPEVASDAPLLVLYTSGTTGAPKGAILTHRNAAANLDGLATAWGWTDADVLVHALPLFHVHGLVLGLFGSLRAGSTLVLLPKFSPEAICAAFEGDASMLFAVPTMYHRIAEHLEAHPDDRAGIAGARLLVSGSAALPVREHERLAALLGQRVVERYGLTETLIDCAIRHDGERRAGTVGPPVEGVEIRLVDDHRRPIAAGDEGAIGEIAVRGPNVFAGYLNRPEATAEVIDGDGWFYTGDLATRSADGYLRIVGRRATDLIKTGGYKVGAGEIEAALLEHPAVREAAVVGAPDEDLGERIVAFVVPSDGACADENALIEHVARLLAPHKRPRAVHLVAELPRNAMGKVLKKQLRAP